MMPNQHSGMRHPLNTNLAIHTGPVYKGFRVLTPEGGLIKGYLDTVLKTTDYALDEHPRTYAMRFDLRWPRADEFHVLDYSNEPVGRFVKHLRGSIEEHYHTAVAQGRRAHQSALRYIWAREVGASGRPHLHFLTYVNRDTYFGMGKYGSVDRNMYNRIRDAWDYALDIQDGFFPGLVHMCGDFHVFARDGRPGWADLIQAGSYLCKLESKEYGTPFHAFGSSCKNERFRIARR